MGRGARGVRGIRLADGDEVVGCVLVVDEKKLLTVTENGFGKRSGFDDFKTRNRGGKGVIVHGLSDKTGLLAELKALAASLGVAERGVFAGAQTKIPECLALADLVVSGNVTKPESFGLSVAEALAMNKPVRLLRRFGGAADILAAVASARQPPRREAVRALCDFDIMSRKTLAVYEELVR